MALPSELLLHVLTNNGYVFGGPTDWSVHIGARPTEVDRSITLADTGGTDPDPRWLLDFPSIQIIVRGQAGDYKVAANHARMIKDLLLGTPSQNIGSDRLVSVVMAGEFGFIGFDDSDRPLYSLNFNLIVEPAQTAESNRLPL